MPKTVAMNHRNRTTGKALVGLGIAGVATMALVFARREVEGPSMLPTLQPGDRLLLRRRRRSGHLAPGTLVAFVDPRPGEARLVVKRVVDVEGDAVRVLGDNPAASTDSRTYGPVPKGAIPWVVLRRYARAQGDQTRA
jgi:nickel-type superoxide dismutase maturation protease